MANDSSTGGPLTPAASPAPLQDAALQDFLQAWIVGITGLSGDLVRPRWQPEPPNLPDATVTWVAFGITRRTADTFAAELHYSTPTPYNQIRRHEILHLLASFYGPNADEYASILREGMQVAQNLELLGANSMGLVSSEDTVAVPELVKQQWLYRVDLAFSIRRQIVRDYSVLDLASASGTLDNEVYTTPISVKQ